MTARKRTLALIFLSLTAAGLSACGTGTSASNFKGPAHSAAQAVANLQSAATAGEASKICKEILARAVVAKLQTAGGCAHAVKSQLNEIDNFEASVEAIKLAKAGSIETATASVKSTYAGKKRISTLTLVNEGGKWRISGLG